MDFALAQIDVLPRSEEGVPLTLKDLGGKPIMVPPVPGKEPEPVQLILLGADSAQYRDAQQQMVRRRMAKAKDNPEGIIDADQIRVEGIDCLVRCTIGWVNVTDKAGKQIPFSPEAVRALYTAMPVVVEQADNFMADRRNFLPAASAD